MPPIVLRQTSAFANQIKQLQNESQFLKLAGRLREHPELGDVIPGTGGLRKIRVALPGKGNRGGARIIYIWLREANELFFLWLYSKGESSDLTTSEKKHWLRSQPKSNLSTKTPRKKRRDDTLGDILLGGLREVLAHAQGKITLKEIVLPERVREISPVEIRSIRDKLNVSQVVFAGILNVPTVTAISWEKGRRKPTGAALRLLDLARRDPRRVLELTRPVKAA